MISNGHQIDNVHKKKDIDLILNKNQSVFECPKAIYPDIRLEYIANGPDASLNIRPDVWFQLPIDSSLRIQDFEVKFSFENLNSDQWLMGNTTARQYDQTSDGLNYYKVSGYGILTSSIIPTESYLSKNALSDSSTWIRYSSGIMTGRYNDSGEYLGSINSNQVLAAGQAVSAELTTGIHYAHVGDEPTFVYDGASSSNPSANGVIGTSPMNVFCAYSGEGVCYSGTKIYYIKHYAHAKKDFSDTGLTRYELIGYWIPILHWDTDSSTYKPCFYDKVNKVYSSYNRGTDTPVYSVSGDKILDYIGNGAYLGVERQVYFDTSIYRDGFPAFEFGYSDCLNKPDARGRAYVFGIGTYSYTSTGIQLAFIKSRASNNPTVVMNGTELVFSKISNSSQHNVMIVCQSQYSYAAFDSSIDMIMGAASCRDDEPFWIFRYARYNSSTGNYDYYNNWGATRIHYFNISNMNDYNPMACMIPVLHNGTPCFYDLKRGIYIYNSGTGKITYKLTGVTE